MNINRILSVAFLLLICQLLNSELVAQTSSSTTYSVKGKVIDAATKKPLAGIHVDLKGLRSQITANDGTFEIKLPKNDVILIVSGAEFATQEVAVRGREMIDIELYEDNYKGAQKAIYTPKGNFESSTLLTNSWSGITENTDLSVAVTPNALLQGFAAGVNTVVRSGLPGSGSNIYIHGLSSMNAGSMPLFVIDGMPVENSSYASSLIGNYFASPLSSVDIKDIESITILKDGTSVYGIKGANGVVLIKTKKAKELKTTINVHAHTGINFEPVQIPVLNAFEHKNLLSEIIQRNNPNASYADIMSLPYFDRTVPTLHNWGYEGNSDFYRYNHDTNWQNTIYQTNFNQNYSLNVSGGDEVANYMLSLGFLNQQSALKGTDYQRFNTRFNAEIRLTNKSYFHTNMSYVFGTKSLANEGDNIDLNPILSALTKAPFTTSHFYTEEGKLSPNVEDYDIFGNSNPYVLANSNLTENINYRFMGSFLLGTKLNKYININALFGLNFNKERERIFYSSTGIYYTPINNTDIRNQSQHRVDRFLSLYSDAYVNYDQQFSTQHKISARAGLRYQSNNAENDFANGFNSLSDDFKGISYGDALLRSVGGSIGSWSWLSAYGTVDYVLMSRYIVNATLSGDATSRSGETAASMFLYPSASIAWLVSSENFLKNADWLSLLKIRASYGESGNDEIGNYTARRYYVSQNILGNYGMALGNMANMGLKPERTTKVNFGFDFSALKERINISADIYSNTVSDMILLTTPDQQTGFTSAFSNSGSMRNTGIDITLNTRILNTKLFKWDIGLTLSKYKNEVLNLAGEEFYTEIMGATVQTKVGQPLGVFYGYKTAGVFSTIAEAQEAGLYEMHGLVKVPFAEGDVRFVNQTSGDKLIDENDRVIIGNPNPDLFGAITNTFKYGNLSMTANFIYSLGNDVYNYTRSQLENLSTYNNQSLAVLTRWRKEGDITSVPKASLGDPMHNARFSDRWIEDGSYLRLKTLTLSYDFPTIKQLPEGSLTIFATAENVLTLTKYKGSDPEFGFGQSPLYYGIDPGVMSQPRTVSLGVRLGL